MKSNRPSRFALSGIAGFTLMVGLGACADLGNPGNQGPVPGGNAVDTRTTTLPGSVMPSVGGAGNGGGISGGGAGAGSFGGGR